MDTQWSLQVSSKIHPRFELRFQVISNKAVDKHLTLWSMLRFNYVTSLSVHIYLTLEDK